MNFDNLPNSLKLVLAVISGGGLAQAFNFLVSKAKVKIGGDASLRKDLMTQVKESRDYAKQQRLEINDWTKKHYEVLQTNLDLESHNKELKLKIRGLEQDMEAMRLKTEKEKLELKEIIREYQESEREVDGNS